jgi:hypothetical protein
MFERNAFSDAFSDWQDEIVKSIPKNRPICLIFLMAGIFKGK